MKLLRPAACALGFFVVATALYTIVTAGLGNLLFPREAGGSLIVEGGKIRGSALLGQGFSRPDRFHGRPSAVDYDAAASGASNLGPTSATLSFQIEERWKALVAENGETIAGGRPSELLLASGSGLDPHLSPQAALYQVPRVAKALRLGPDGERDLAALVASMTEGRTFGLLGEARVNVLELNLELGRRYGD